MTGTLFAGGVLLLCLLALLRQALSPARQQRVDTHLRRIWIVVRSRALALWAQALALWKMRHWWRNRREARQAARDAIERAARRAGERDGNVFKPDAFKKPRKPH